MVRRALVTGGSRGLGLAVARALARDGLDVVGTYAHDEAAAQATREQLQGEQLRISLARCDAGSAAEVACLFDRIAPVDVVVHAAGFTRDRLLLSMPDGDFDALLAVHLKGGFLASRHAVSAMLARRWGRIVYLIFPQRCWAGAARRTMRPRRVASSDCAARWPARWAPWA